MEHTISMCILFLNVHNCTCVCVGMYIYIYIHAKVPGNEDLLHAQHGSEKFHKHWLYGVIQGLKFKVLGYCFVFETFMMLGFRMSGFASEARGH